MSFDLPITWRRALSYELTRPSMLELEAFVERERSLQTVYPPASEVFTAFHLTPYDRVKAVILGQDPYHDAGQACGLAFSVPPGIKPPPSLVNIFKELHSDLGVAMPETGSLDAWARRGVLLLNTVLTVRAHEANSHRGHGWEEFTDAVIEALSRGPRPIVFVLWGRPAQQKRPLIDETRHAVIIAPHPSPLSAHTGFFGSRPFTAVNEALAARGESPIDWRL